jgi:CRP-like cAMP-binding protein
LNHELSTLLLIPAMSKFFNYNLQKFVSQKAGKAILQKLVLIDFKENAIILSPGQYQQHLYFIRNGIVRCYYKDMDVEWTNWFAAEGNPVFSTESFLNGNPSPEYIQTCTPVSLYQITKEDYLQLMEEFPELYQLAFNLLQDYLRIAERRMHGSHMLTALKRYEEFIETHRHIVNRVQMQHIASYLGITPTHLSRVRREFANKTRDKISNKINAGTEINLC